MQKETNVQNAEQNAEGKPKPKLTLAMLKAKAKAKPTQTQSGPSASAPKLQIGAKVPAKLTAKPAPGVPKFKLTASAPEPKPAKSLRDLLHGTGVTKKLAERAAIAQEKAAQINTALDNPERALKIAERARQEREPEVPETPLQPKVLKVANIPLGANLEYDESQERAVTEICKEQFACLIGAAGTGKTTTTKRIIEAIRHQIPSVDHRLGALRNKDTKDEDAFDMGISFCAFTGRAVQQMKRALPETYHPMCATIHATLGYQPEWYDDVDEHGNPKRKVRFVPSFGTWRKLPYKLYIIDEAGMVPIYLWDQLVDAMLPDARVIMIGDINQLPPVQGRSVLGFAMTQWPTYELQKIHRQAADNPIIANAHRILAGDVPRKIKDQFDVINMPAGSIETFNKVIRAVKILHGRDEFHEMEDGIIVPQNKDILGQTHLNETLVPYFNPEKKVDGRVLNKRIAIATGITRVAYAVGDKVMLLQNDNERGLTNGMCGTIVSININGQFRQTQETSFDVDKFMSDLGAAAHTLHEEINPDADSADEDGSKAKDDNQRQASHVATVDFMGKEITFQTAGDYRKLTHAYAFTCHKSQGGEYPTVIIVAHSANWRMLSREWLYTAVTRAQQRVVLLCNDRGLLQALKTQRIAGRTLAEKAKRFIELSGKDDTSIPNLPKPQKVS